MLDLWAASHEEHHRTGSLNAFLARGPEAWQYLRVRLRDELTDEAYRAATEPFLVPVDEVALHLPIEVADYVDFYRSEQHAENVGRIFRPDSPSLPPNWKHLPIGYHGRAGTVAVSGTPVVRPRGQRRDAGSASRRSARRRGWTSRPSSASWSVRRRTGRCRSAPSPSTCSASAC